METGFIASLAPVASPLLWIAFLLLGIALQDTILLACAQLEDFSSSSIGVLGSVYILGFAIDGVLALHAIRAPVIAAGFNSRACLIDQNGAASPVSEPDGAIQR